MLPVLFSVGSICIQTVLNLQLFITFIERFYSCFSFSQSNFSTHIKQLDLPNWNAVVLVFFPASLGAQLGTGDGQTVGVQSCALGDSHTGGSGVQQQGTVGVPICTGSANLCK